MILIFVFLQLEIKLLRWWNCVRLKAVWNLKLLLCILNSWSKSILAKQCLLLNVRSLRVMMTMIYLHLFGKLENPDYFIAQAGSSQKKFKLGVLYFFWNKILLYSSIISLRIFGNKFLFPSSSFSVQTCLYQFLLVQIKYWVFVG